MKIPQNKILSRTFKIAFFIVILLRVNISPILPNDPAFDDFIQFVSFVR